jgi:high-affinity iron transporter
MLLTSVIVVLREVLESALIISVLVALSGTLGIPRRWVVWALGLGLAGAVSFSLGINTVTDWFDGVGMEVVSAFMQGSIYLLLVAFSLWVLWSSRGSHTGSQVIRLILVLVVALAVAREGVEVLIYMYAHTESLPHFIHALTGAVIGAAIGISVGILLYYLLSHPVIGKSPTTGLVLLALIGAGLLSQAVLLLIQADWVPSHLPLWDTSAWLSESSVTGQLLYVLIGYEATPTAIQVSFYFGGLIVLFTIAVLTAVFRSRSARRFTD